MCVVCGGGGGERKSAGGSLPTTGQFCVFTVHCVMSMFVYSSVFLLLCKEPCGHR